MTLDRVGQRYGKLPSEVLRDGSTLDIMVMDISITYEKMRQDRANGLLPNIKEEDLIKGLENFKRQNGW